MKKLLAILFVLILAVPVFAADKPAKKELYFYNWSEYMPDAVIKKFTKETGIKVIYTTYESNEAMYAKVKLLDAKGYDLVIPSTYYVSKMSREGLLQKIDKSKLRNLKNIDPDRLGLPFDPQNEVSIPYLWGSTGLAVNTKKIPLAEVQSWGDLWKPAFKGRILLTNDPREVFYMGLRLLGYSGNTRNPDEIKKAYEKLKPLMASVKLFNSESPKVPYLAGEVDTGLIWNGEAFLAQKENKNLAYVYPTEGVILWMDSFVVPKNARNAEHAHAFIDFVLRPEIAKMISEEIGYATPNQEAFKLLDRKVRENRTVYPDPAELAKGEYQLDVGDAITTYQEYWEKLKAAR